MIKQRDKREIQTIEEHLRNYRSYQTAILNLQKKIEYLYSPNITSNYELREGSKGTFTVYSSTENAVIDCLESPEIKKANETIKLYEMIIDTINQAVSQLSEDEQLFVRLRYFQNRSILNVSMELGYSERHLHRIRQKVLNHLFISLGHLGTV